MQAPRAGEWQRRALSISPRTPWHVFLDPQRGNHHPTRPSFSPGAARTGRRGWRGRRAGSATSPAAWKRVGSDPLASWTVSRPASCRRASPNEQFGARGDGERKMRALCADSQTRFNDAADTQISGRWHTTSPLCPRRQHHVQARPSHYYVLDTAVRPLRSVSRSSTAAMATTPSRRGCCGASRLHR